MSETMCKCGALVVKQADGTGLHYGAWFSGECRYSFEPAEPVIEVAPGEPTIKSVRLVPGTIHGANYGPPPNIAVGWLPGVNVPAVPATCEYCGPVCYRGAAHNIRVEDGARYTDDPVPGVLAQEAPREKSTCVHCDKPIARSSPNKPWLHNFGNGEWQMNCLAFDKGPVAEPQAGAQPDHVPDVKEVMGNMGAGAQVPSQDEMPKATLITDWMPGEANREEYFRSVTAGWRKKCEELEKHLNSIKSYATEAAKTPITREDMHDPLKAQTFYDEAKGFERLVLSEIGGK